MSSLTVQSPSLHHINSVANWYRVKNPCIIPFVANYTKFTWWHFHCHYENDRHLHVKSRAKDEDIDGLWPVKQVEDNGDSIWQLKQSSLAIIHKEGDIVGNYKITKVLGQGGMGVTYEAETSEGEVVALKSISLRNMKAWKDLDLFSREATVLRSLKHPGIAEYIDYFEVDSDTDRSFFIVQRLARGESLERLVMNGRRFYEKEVVEIAIQVLEVLKYLQSLRPPVIHRDIKPENIILDEVNGKVQLVDFGAVQDAASVAPTGSTVVGTYGYMAPEQFQNRATLQTDIYGLGGTLLFLLSGRSPSSFPQKRLKIYFQDSVAMSSQLIDIIEHFLEPAPEDRFQSPDEALHALNSWRNLDTAVSNFTYAKKNNRPAGTRVDLKRTSSSLQIRIPPMRLSAEILRMGTFAVAWNSFLVLWTRSAIVGGAPLLFTLFSLPFWVVGASLAQNVLSSLTIATDIKITRSNFSITWEIPNLWKHTVEGQTKDISSIDITAEGKQNGELVTTCCITEGIEKYNFGAGLESIEKEWLINEMSNFLEVKSKLK